jgi:hypothetical protein
MRATLPIDVAIAIAGAGAIAAAVMTFFAATGQLPERQQVEVCISEGNTTTCHKETRTINK